MTVDFGKLLKHSKSIQCDVPVVWGLVTVKAMGCRLFIVEKWNFVCVITTFARRDGKLKNIHINTYTNPHTTAPPLISHFPSHLHLFFSQTLFYLSFPLFPHSFLSVNVARIGGCPL